VSVTLSGALPLGIEPQTVSIGIPSPTVFAQWVLRESLAAEGVELKSPLITVQPDFAPLAHNYTPENQIAEHISPPLAEEIKVTLKVSQNLHAGMGPYLLGALVGKDTTSPLKKGFELEREFLNEARLDLSGASQGDGAGGDWADLFSPDFMCHYLVYWTTRPDYDVLFHALPILGIDGTLGKIQKDNPGAGHVFAKTGTFGSGDHLNGKMMLNGRVWPATSSPNSATNSPSPPTSTTCRFHPTQTPRKMSPAKHSAKSPPPPTTPGCEWNSYRCLRDGWSQ
jgi:D-alanyl-D-alanine carboxypeptidase/D-alanyl-D-alanine-endopeptidase (penicillin-binding protein 4)